MKRSFLKALGLGFAAGCLGGAVSGLAEGWWILRHSGGTETIGVAAYSVALYAAVGALAGAAAGIFIEAAGRVGRRDMSDGKLYALICSLVIVGMSLVAWRFLIRRDLFQEKLAWTSPMGLVVQAGMVMAGIAVIFLFWTLIGSLLDIVSKRFVLKFWFAPLVVLLISGGMAAWAHIGVKRAQGKPAGAGAKKPSGPNILLVMADTLRADHTDPYGAGGLTPNLMALAKMGITFGRAYAQASWTRPSVATVMSGRFPSSHKAIYKMDVLPAEVETVGEALRGAGYTTAAVVTNYVTSPYFGFAQGFDEYHYLEPTYFLGAGDATSKLVFYEGIKALWSRFVAKGSAPGAQYQDGRVLTDRAVEWFERWNRKAGKDDRFFMFVQYMDPHDPYFAHPYDGTVVARKATADPPKEWLGKMQALYTGEVKFFDEHFGRLLGFLQRQAWWNDTLVIFFADHGEELLDHGGWWHGDTLYEEQVRVPLIVRLPGGEAAGRVVEGSLVGLVDIAPTICRFAGVEIPSSFQGQDLFGERVEPLLAEEDHVGNSLRSILYRKGKALWKIIKANKGNPRGLPEKSLFNVIADPVEKNNLAGSERDEYDGAAAQLGQIEEQAAKGAAARKSVELDKTAKDHLKDLGYIRE
jgi:arylsulfatase A-like enzyme